MGALIRQFKVMSVIFLIVVTLVAIWIGFLMVQNAINPPKPKTAAEALADLSLQKDHSVSPHIEKLGGASVNVKTSWNNGVVEYQVNLLDGNSQLEDLLKNQPTYSFIITWYEDDKPCAQILAPFEGFEKLEEEKGRATFTASGQQNMSQATYEKLNSVRSWDVNWGPAKR